MNPRFHLEIMRKVRDALMFQSAARDNVLIRPIRTRSAEDDDIAIIISPASVDLVQELSAGNDYELLLNVDIDVPDDEPSVIETSTEVQADVSRILNPIALSASPFALSYLISMKPIGGEDLAATDESELPDLIWRTQWEFVYRTTLADL